MLLSALVGRQPGSQAAGGVDEGRGRQEAPRAAPTYEGRSASAATASTKAVAPRELARSRRDQRWAP
eukprot:15482019-Alexandrium_andersonii.AAC.1